jgi:hypothetical protein
MSITAEAAKGRAADEVRLGVEGVVDGGVSGEEALGGGLGLELRAAARARYARANGISASDMGAVVHHSEGLEYAHLKPGADPNRLANLWGLLPEAHAIANREAAAFRAALNGRIPTQAEIMAVKLKIDRMVAPYIQRAGVSRPGPTPK